MNKNVYPLFREEYALIKRFGESIVHPLNSNSSKAFTSSSYEYMRINKTAAELLSLCDGRHSIDDIIKDFIKRYDDKEDTISLYIEDFLQEGVDKGHITLCTQRQERDVNVYGDFSLATPVNACFEITKRCSLRCRHCFNDSGKASSDEMTTEQVYFVINRLNSIGIQKLMITGGEPTERSDFLDIINYASDKFIALSVASNGYNITSKLATALSAHKRKIVVQISIDGIEEHHNKIRRVNNSYRKATEAVVYLRKVGIPVIIACTINAENFEDMDDMACIAQELGAVQLTYAITINQGRARENGLANGIDTEKIISKALELKNEYLHKGLFIQIEDDTLNQISTEKNLRCGAGVSHIAIRDNGDVSPCLNFFFKYGNILANDLREIFSPENFDFFSSLIPPSKALCGNCNELSNCMNCHARGYDSLIKDCSWKKQYNDTKRRIFTGGRSGVRI